MLAFEPFDCAPVYDEVFGRLAGSNGGPGFGAPWQDSIGGDAFIHHKRGDPESFYGGGWNMVDGMVKTPGWR